MLQKIHTCQPSNKTCYTNAYQKHTPNKFAYHIKYCNGDFKPPFEYSGRDPARVFYEELKEYALYIAREYYDKFVHMKALTESEKLKFKTQKNCHICEEPFNDISEKVQDHNHLTGLFRGAAHDGCNLNYKNPQFIKIFFHNLNDAHLFIKQFGDDSNNI